MKHIKSNQPTTNTNTLTQPEKFYQQVIAHSHNTNPPPFPDIGDFHSANAIAFYGIEKATNTYKRSPKEFKEHLRTPAKVNGLALLYGGSYKVLQDSLHITEAEAKQLHHSFFQNLSGFTRHIKQVEKESITNKQTKNLFGRTLHLQGIVDKDPKVVAAYRRKMFNYPIQSIAGDLTKLIINELFTLSEDNHTNNLAGDNIHYPYYNRIVSTSYKNLTSELIQALNQCEDGNILFVVREGEFKGHSDNDTSDTHHYIDTNTNPITHKFPRPIQLTTDIIEKFNLTIEF